MSEWKGRKSKKEDEFGLNTFPSHPSQPHWPQIAWPAFRGINFSESKQKPDFVFQAKLNSHIFNGEQTQLVQAVTTLTLSPSSSLYPSIAPLQVSRCSLLSLRSVLAVSSLSLIPVLSRRWRRQKSPPRAKTIRFTVPSTSTTLPITVLSLPPQSSSFPRTNFKTSNQCCSLFLLIPLRPSSLEPSSFELLLFGFPLSIPASSLVLAVFDRSRLAKVVILYIL